jgi:site-specific recombinase XerD
VKGEVRGDWELLTLEFVRYLKVKGIRSLRKIPYELKPFFLYLEENGYELYEVNYKKAQDYQTCIATLEEPDGGIHYSTSTVRSMTYAAGSFYDFLKTKGIALTNPFKHIRIIKGRKRLPKHIPKEDLMGKFLDSLKCFWKGKSLRQRRELYKVHVIAELMYATGLRISEVAGLTCDDIDLEAGIVLVRDGKGRKDRKAYLNEYAAKVLGIYMSEMREYVNHNKGSSMLFGVKDGKCLDKALNGRLKDTGKALGIKRFTSHSFRHSLGFHLLRRGCAINFIQLILGHDKISSTSIYTKVEKTDLRSQLDIYHPRRIKSLTTGGSV